MKTDLNALRNSLSKLHADRVIGDVSERNFQSEVAKRTVDLYRAVIGCRLRENEEILAEHHSISSHFRMTQSLLKEPEQHAVSYFLTGRRLLRLRSTIYPGQPPTADNRDDTVIDEIGLDRVRSLRTRVQFRFGEAAVGAVMCLIAVSLYELLQFTAPVLIGLGGLGVLHALAGPTRWIEVQASHGNTGDPMIIYAIGNKSARKLARLLRERARKP